MMLVPELPSEVAVKTVTSLASSCNVTLWLPLLTTSWSLPFCRCHRCRSCRPPAGQVDDVADRAET